MSIQNPNLCQRPLRTVLIGVSLEGESEQVMRSGLAVARAAGAQVYFVHALPGEPRLPSLETGLGDDYFQALIADRRETLHKEIERLGIVDSELAAGRFPVHGPFSQCVSGSRHWKNRWTHWENHFCIGKIFQPIRKILGPIGKILRALEFLGSSRFCVGAACRVPVKQPVARTGYRRPRFECQGCPR
ncbi:MAG: hypothetical protein WAM82_26640 [Thermoanaerobaculia bacterium]